MEINEGYVIRRSILFDNKCGIVLGEDPKAPNPFVTWQFNERDGRRGYFWGRYHNTLEQEEADFQERAESYQRRFRVKVVEQSTGKRWLHLSRISLRKMRTRPPGSTPHALPRQKIRISKDNRQYLPH